VLSDKFLLELLYLFEVDHRKMIEEIPFYKSDPVLDCFMETKEENDWEGLVLALRKRFTDKSERITLLSHLMKLLNQMSRNRLSIKKGV